MKKEGYAIDKIDDKAIGFKVDGQIYVVVIYDNGDIQFGKFYRADDSFSLRKVNKLNQEYRIGTLTLGDNGDLTIGVLLRNDGNGLARQQVIQGARDIVNLDKITVTAFYK